MPAEKTALYRLFDEADTLLYVGISQDPDFRWQQHVGDKPWAKYVVRRTAEWHDSREAALAAEPVAIKAEKPLHNIAHRPAATRSPMHVERTGDPFTDLVAELSEIEDPRERAIRVRNLEKAMKELTPAIRSLVDSAVTELRTRLTVAQVAELLGVSEQRISQMATGRHRHKPPTTVLPAEDFDALVADLDRPAEAVPELVDLFKRPRVTPPADSDA